MSVKRAKLNLRPNIDLELEFDPKGFFRITEILSQPGTEAQGPNGPYAIRRTIVLSAKKAQTLANWVTNANGKHITKSIDPIEEMNRSAPRRKA